MYIVPHARRVALFAAACLTALRLSPALAAPETAASTTGFSAAQRHEIVSIIRGALKQDPSILGDALAELQKSMRNKAKGENLAALSRMHDALKAAPDYAIRGNPSGKLSVVEFYDPRCGYCRGMLETVDRFIKAEPNVRFVEKIVPVLGEKSVLEAEAILAAAQQGAYEKMKRTLMLDKTPPTIEHIREVALKIGLDAKRLEKDMHAPAIQKMLQANLAQARAIGLEGTPTFAIGTVQIIPGAVSYDELQRAAHTALAG